VFTEHARQTNRLNAAIDLSGAKSGRGRLAARRANFFQVPTLLVRRLQPMGYFLARSD